jgi:hypothetical protein
MRQFHVLVQYGNTDKIKEVDIDGINGEVAMREAEYFCFLSHQGTKLNDWFAFDFKFKDKPSKVKKEPVPQHG